MTDKKDLMPTEGTNVTVGMDTSDGFALLQRQAKMLAQSDFVPTAFKSVPNAVIAITMAHQMQTNPITICQNMYLVYNQPAFSTKFLLGRVASEGKYTALRYTFSGEPHTDSWTCYAWARELLTGDRLDGTAVSIGMAKKEGWYQKKGSKWQTIPEQMLRYRAASFWIGAYAPQASMGFPSVEEARDMPPKEQHRGRAELVDVSEKIAEKMKSKPAFTQAVSEELRDRIEKTVEAAEKTIWPQAVSGKDGAGWADSNGDTYDAAVHAKTIKGIPPVDADGAFLAWDADGLEFENDEVAL